MSDTPTKPAVTNIWANGASGGDITAPPSAYIEAGWPLSSTPPPRQYFNWLLNYLHNGVRYLMRGGISAWDATDTYNYGDIVRGSDQRSYRDNTGSNTGADPTLTNGLTGSGPWTECMASHVTGYGSYNATLLGVSGTPPVGNIKYWCHGSPDQTSYLLVTMLLPGISGLSNSVSCALDSSNFPANLRPLTIQAGGLCSLFNNGTAAVNASTGFQIDTTGQISFILNGTSSGFANNGTLKGLTQANVITFVGKQ